MKILLTGFDPFDGEPINPSWEAVKRLPDTLAGAELIKLEIPTQFQKGIETVRTAIAELTPDVVLNVGQAGGRKCVTVEKVAINYVNATRPDNVGVQPVDKTLVPGGPDAYFATVPVMAMVENVRAHGLPCELSLSAGAYVCNCMMYNVLHLAATRYPGLRAGFIHVPYADSQVVDKTEKFPSQSIGDMTSALSWAVEAAVRAQT